MPTYQYRCTACGHQLEAVQSFSDSPLTECPECQGKLRKLFNSVGIVFKGSGFYRTDSRASGNGGNGSKSSEPAKSDASSSSSSSSEGKSSEGKGSGGNGSGGKASSSDSGSGKPASTAA